MVLMPSPMHLAIPRHLPIQRHLSSPHQPSPPNRPWEALMAGTLALAALGLILLAPGGLPAVQAQSQLLDAVKQNPALAKQLCSQLRQMNAAGLPSTSSQAVATIAQQQKLSTTDAEVLTTYVVGIYCPDVR